MKAGLLLVVVVALGGCTTVRLSQRGNCWVRSTETWAGALTEEMGPCSREAPQWVPDRLTRLVQECVAQSDYRWQNRALAAWNRGDPLPDREPGEHILDSCVTEATQSVISDNDALKERLDDVAADRDHLRAQGDHLADVLGEAAKKPAGSAVATANAKGDGTSSTKTDSSTETSHQTDLASSPPIIVPAPQVTTQPVVVRIAPRPAPVRRRPPAKVVCPVPAAPKPATQPVTSDTTEAIAKPASTPDCVCEPAGH